MIDRDLLKHRAEFQRALTNNKYEVSEEGLFFPKQSVMVSGVYTHDVNGFDERSDSNLLTTEGLNHMLDVTLHDASKVTTWYVKLFSGNVTVLATWTAANFTSNATEITSNSEGYSESTAPVYVEAAAAAGVTTNTASKAAFTIATTTSVTVWGAALSSSSTKGGTTGTLMSASKFGAVRTLYNTDVFNVGYSITLTST
jgi:hypothetical protein